jgi:cell pole-organizing protein PopZ
MSTSQTPPPASSPATASPAAGDPSMEDILASIRRILSEDEVAAGSPPAPHPEPEADHAGVSDVLVLNPAMMVPEPPPAPTVTEPVAEEMMPPAEIPTPQTLVAPEAAAAAAVSVGSLVRTLAAERTMQVRSGGPTIEDIVREELRPLLKEWLNANLPTLVERLVRAEIERVVGRAVP